MASLLDTLPPELRDYVLAQASKPDMAGFDKAAASDRQRAGLGAMGQNLSRAAALVRGERVGPMALPPSDDLRTWVLRKQAEGKPEDPLARLATAAEIAKDLRPSKDSANPDNEPAPPEWGALPGMTRGQAIASGYAKKREPKPLDLNDEPADATQVAEMRRLGLNPSLARTRGEASRYILQATNPRAAAAAEKRHEEKESGRFLGEHFEFDQDVPPDAIPDAKRAALLEQAGDVAALTQSVDELRNLLKKSGGGKLMGETASRMRTLARDIQLRAKNEGVYNLGVLNGRDYELISDVIADPTRLDAIVRDEAGIRKITTELDTFSGLAKRVVRERARSIKARPRKEGAFYEVKTIRVRRKADGKTGSMPETSFNPDLYEKIDG